MGFNSLSAKSPCDKLHPRNFVTTGSTVSTAFRLSRRATMTRINLIDPIELSFNSLSAKSPCDR